ncbi:MAG: NAD(P)-dependent glycerol-3-phosphate dehydrogenase [Xylophilus ampelinus]
MKIAVLGAGAWGTAIALAAAARTSPGGGVALWARDTRQAEAMRASRENDRYLPGIALPPGLRVDAGDPVALAGAADLVVVATPTAALRGLLARIAHLRMPVAWLCKGFETAADDRSGRAGGPMPHEICAEVAPGLVAGALSGPSFALEVARGQPTALVAASAHAAVRDALVAAFHGPALRVYANDDVVGVEVGGAVKNVMAIATGLCDGLRLGLNARAALVTRGLAEMTRLGVALGARADTFMGLSGLGDLVLTATGDLSRNRKVGLLLAEGRTLREAVDSLGHVAEGAYCARAVVARARGLGLEMPIAEAVVALLDGRMRPAEAVASLMGRDPVAEA